MFKKKTFIISFIVLVVVAVLNYIGNNFYLYWIYKWYDIPMHILGGLWVSLLSLSVYSYFDKNVSIINYHWRVFRIVFLGLLFMIIFWEIFELVGGMTSLNDNGYWPDTLGDILNGFIGGMIGYFFFIIRKKSDVELEYKNNQIIK